MKVLDCYLVVVVNDVSGPLSGIVFFPRATLAHTFAVCNWAFFYPLDLGQPLGLFRLAIMRWYLARLADTVLEWLGCGNSKASSVAAAVSLTPLRHLLLYSSLDRDLHMSFQRSSPTTCQKRL